jgi:putative membrane protein
MSSAQGDLADLSRFIFRAPRWYASLAGGLLLAALAGVAAFESRYVLEDAWQGVFFIGIPTVVAALATTHVDGWLGGRLTYNRSALLALACEVLVIVALVAAGGVALLTSLGGNFVFDALITALALVFALRLLVVVAVSRNSWLAVAPAGIQTAVAGVLLFVYSGTVRYLEIGGPIARSFLSRPEQAPSQLLYVTPTDLTILVATSGLYALLTFAAVRAIDRPWRRALGVSALDFIRGFIGHIAEGTDELESFFQEIGEEAVVPVTVLSFRTDRGEKARFVLPMIHPGPMGEIGGGNLPRRVAEAADGLAFPPHATAGHDFNLVTRAEVETLVEAADKALDRVEYGREATPSVRTRAGDAKMLGQRFGDDALLVTTCSPEFTDDVEYGVGLSAAAEARCSGIGDVMIVDAHNCNNGLAGEDLGHVYPGSERSFEMMQAAGEAGERLAAAATGPLQLGVAWDPTDWTPEEGVGPLGVRVAVTEVGGATTAYVLVDGNNMEPGVRDRVVDAVDSVDEVEVMTTDTHVVNTVESVNQVGAAIDEQRLVALVVDLVERAREDLEPVEAGMATERTRVTVFGNDRTETLASHANAVVALGGAFLAAVVVSAVALSVLIFFFT